MSGALLRNNSQDNLTHRLISTQVVSLLTTLHDPNLRPGVPKHAPSSTESFLAVGTCVEINQCVGCNWLERAVKY